MKIIINALSGIGDALMFTPALSLLRKEFPSAEIDALVMFKGVKDMYGRNKDLNNVIHFDFLKEGAIKSLLFIKKLRKRKYDISINVYPSNRKEYNIINLLIGGKKRGAVKYLRQDSKNFGFLNNIRIVEEDLTHNVKTNIKLIEEICNKRFTDEPSLKFPLTEDDIEFASYYLSENNINDDELVIGFHPGSAEFKNHINRRWEPGKFSELGKKLISENNARVLIFGGPEEKDLKDSIALGINSEKCLAVETPGLAESAAIMQRCSIFISNDSSLMHIASALKLNVAAVIGPTNIAYIHPWKTEHKIISLNLECSPCFYYSPRPLTCIRTDKLYKCVRDISVDMVYNGINQFILE
jgi:heptosyltransferase II